MTENYYVLKCRFHFQVSNSSRETCQHSSLELVKGDMSTFKSRTRQGRHVNSHPPDGADISQLNIHQSLTSITI